MAKEVIGILGQSNAVGNGSGSTPTYSNITFSGGATRIWAMPQPVDEYENPFYPPALVDPARTFIQAADPLGWRQPSPGTPQNPGPVYPAGVGFGIAAADKYIDLRADATLEMGLVQCAWGGSTVADWDSSYRSSRLLSCAWTRLHAAKEWGTLRAVVWYQGESDAQAANADYWPGEVFRIIRDTRAELNLPELLFIVVALGPFPSGLNPASWPRWEQIQSWVKNRMPDISPNLGVVDASDLATNNTTDLHLNAASQVTLGQRIAQKIVDLRP